MKLNEMYNLLAVRMNAHASIVAGCELSEITLELIPGTANKPTTGTDIFFSYFKHADLFEEDLKQPTLHFRYWNACRWTALIP